MGPIGRAAAVLTLFAAGLLPAGAQSLAPSAISIEPQRVGIGLTYNGATVKIRAQVPAGYSAAVRLTAHPGRLELKRMGKRAGLLWMGVGEVSFENVPAVYQVLTSANLSELGSPQSLAEWKLGYESLVPDGVPGAALRSELVGLKEHEGLFSLQQGGLTLAEPEAAKSPVLTTVSEAGDPSPAASPQVLQGSFRLPARAPAGDYTIDLIGFKDGQAFNLGSAKLHLETVGLAKKLNDLAHEHGLAYGISACVIAILVGLLTGLIFQPKSDESH
jgi:hypothetical protein